MLPGSSLWIVKSTMWLRPTLASGSSAKLRVSARKPFGTTGIVCLPSGAGVGIEPSTPTRKIFAPVVHVEDVAAARTSDRHVTNRRIEKVPGRCRCRLGAQIATSGQNLVAVAGIHHQRLFPIPFLWGGLPSVRKPVGDGERRSHPP